MELLFRLILIADKSIGSFYFLRQMANTITLWRVFCAFPIYMLVPHAVQQAFNEAAPSGLGHFPLSLIASCFVALGVVYQTSKLLLTLFNHLANLYFRMTKRPASYMRRWARVSMWLFVVVWNILFFVDIIYLLFWIFVICGYITIPLGSIAYTVFYQPMFFFGFYLVLVSASIVIYCWFWRFLRVNDSSPEIMFLDMTPYLANATPLIRHYWGLETAGSVFLKFVKSLAHGCFFLVSDLLRQFLNLCLSIFGHVAVVSPFVLLFATAWAMSEALYLSPLGLPMAVLAVLGYIFLTLNLVERVLFFESSDAGKQIRTSLDPEPDNKPHPRNWLLWLEPMFGKFRFTVHNRIKFLLFTDAGRFIFFLLWCSLLAFSFFYSLSDPIQLLDNLHTWIEPYTRTPYFTVALPFFKFKMIQIKIASFFYWYTGSPVILGFHYLLHELYLQYCRYHTNVVRGLPASYVYTWRFL